MGATQYRPELDGLRAVAVLAVVLYHAGVGPQAGFVGVDVFFVISGYLITGLLLKQERIDFLDFYARRMRRLVPALMVVVGATLAVSVAMFPMAHIAKSAAAAMLFVANIYFHRTTGGYFDPDTAHLPLLHLWSLGVEEQFYLVWPVLLALVWRWRQKVLVPLVVTLAVASLIASEVVDSHTAFYSMPTRFWEMAAGGLIAIVRPVKVRLAEAGLLLLGIALFVPLEGFPGLAALPAVGGSALIILTLHGGGEMGLAGRLLRLRPMVFTGLISYSLYLWHWPLLAFETLLTVGAPSLVLRLGLAVLSGLLAWLTYKFVETPFRRDTTGVPNGKVVLTSLALSAGLAVGAMRMSDQQTALHRPNERCHYTHGATPPDGLPPTECNSIPLREPEILVWGDSHAMAWKPFAWRLGERRGMSVAAFTYGACPPALGYDFGQPACTRFNDQAFEYIKTHRLDTVILSARLLARMHRLPDTYSNRYANVTDEEFEQRKEFVETNLARTIDLIAPLVPRILVFGPSPQARKDVPLCRSLGQDVACAMSRREFDEYARASYALLDQLARRHPNVTVIRVDDFLCDAQSCPITRDGKAVFTDSHHLTESTAKAFFDVYTASRADR